MSNVEIGSKNFFERKTVVWLDTQYTKYDDLERKQVFKLVHDALQATDDNWGNDQLHNFTWLVQEEKATSEEYDMALIKLRDFLYSKGVKPTDIMMIYHWW